MTSIKTNMNNYQEKAAMLIAKYTQYKGSLISVSGKRMSNRGLHAGFIKWFADIISDDEDFDPIEDDENDEDFQPDIEQEDEAYEPNDEEMEDFKDYKEFIESFKEKPKNDTLKPQEEEDEENEFIPQDQFSDDDILLDEDNIPLAEDVESQSLGILNDCYEAIRDIAGAKGYSPEDIDSLVLYFSDWLLEDPKISIMDEALLTKNTRYWENAVNNPLHSAFARFVIPLFSISASEAIVERSFWYQRRILGDHAVKTSEDLEKARLNYALLQRRRRKKH